MLSYIGPMSPNLLVAEDVREAWDGSGGEGMEAFPNPHGPGLPLGAPCTESPVILHP